MNQDEKRGGCADAAAYVLGALTDDEHEAFVAHLSTCAVCREEVAALQSVAAALPAAAPQFSAPPALKRRVMWEVRHDARERAGARERATGAPRRVLGMRVRVVPAMAAALAAALAIAIAISGGGGGPRVVGAHVSASGASASVRLSGGHAFLRISGMPQPPPGRVYELWLKRAGAPEATDALFTVTSRGDATVGVPGSVAGVKALLVTAEPRGGSLAPTRAPVIVANL